MKASTFIGGSAALFSIGVLQGMWLTAPVFLLGVIVIAALVDYLLHGSSALVLPKSWLENRQRMTAYEGYTRRQLQQGSVVADAAAMRRRAFWQAIEAKQPAKSPIKFPMKVSQR